LSDEPRVPLTVIVSIKLPMGTPVIQAAKRE